MTSLILILFPLPLFLVKNLAEAEYSVALFMYMRLLGYPSERISILTTYNGQKHLIRDVINQRCAANPYFGQPHKVRPSGNLPHDKRTAGLCDNT